MRVPPVGPVACTKIQSTAISDENLKHQHKSEGFVVNARENGQVIFIRVIKASNAEILEVIRHRLLTNELAKKVEGGRTRASVLTHIVIW